MSPRPRRRVSAYAFRPTTGAPIEMIQLAFPAITAKLVARVR